ncbi:MAG TPA: glutamate carboxypeptidase [Burkholderiaceae bacterium]|jgi:glutamate carboxypeptidase|nr:glutamate carboxypeptidase [Burkholderiaceae bacterium]
MSFLRSLQRCLPRKALLAALAGLLSTSAALAAPDSALREAAQKEQPAVIDSLRAMVEIESGSHDLQGLASMARLVESRLQALGFKTERHKGSTAPGADIVVGTLKGSGKRHLMLQAHMDTVYEKGILKTQPWKVDGNRLYGPGIADDKGGIAVILHGLKLLQERGWKDFATLTVLVNADEEIGSMGSGELISKLADQHDVVLSFEPTGAKAVSKHEFVLLGAAGTARATLSVKGRGSHAGAAPELGRNAILEISHQMIQTRDIGKTVPGIVHNWTNVVSNKATNQIPELATAIGDVRITVPGAEKTFEAAMRARLASSKLIPDTEILFDFETRRPAYLAGPKGQALAKRAQAIYQELDRELLTVPMTGGGTDAGYAGRSGKAAVLESLGLAGHGYHARDEYIEIDSIVPRLYLMGRMLIELGKDQ